MKSEDVQDVLLSLSLKLIVNKQEWTLLVGCKEHFFFLCRNVLLPEEYSFVLYTEPEYFHISTFDNFPDYLFFLLFTHRLFNYD